MNEEPATAPVKWWVKALIWTAWIALALLFLSLMNNAPPWAWGMLLGVYWITRKK